MTPQREVLRALPSWGAGALVVLVGLSAIVLRTMAGVLAVLAENAGQAGRLTTALLADGAERAEIAIHSRYQHPHTVNTGAETADGVQAEVIRHA